MSRIEELDETTIRIGAPQGKFFEKKLKDIRLLDLDWLVGQSWLCKKYPEDGAKIREYLEHPTIKKMMEEVLE